jgi:hypothetical protein
MNYPDVHVQASIALNLEIWNPWLDMSLAFQRKSHLMKIEVAYNSNQYLIDNFGLIFIQLENLNISFPRRRVT